MSQRQQGGDWSTNQQAGGDIYNNVTQYYGVTPEQLRELATLLASLQLNSDSRDRLTDLIELPGDENLPTVAELNPYQLGATASLVGNISNYGVADPYVLRTAGQADQRLDAALDAANHGGPMVVIVGPSKAGKTRTSYEALRRRLPQALLATPLPGKLNALIAQEIWQTSTDTIVVWLDDLQRFITHADPLTTHALAALRDRPGPVIVLATLRSEERQRLRNGGELNRESHMLLEQAHEVSLRPTCEDRAETADAQAAYPTVRMDAGLGAELAGAPELLRRYEDAKDADRLQRAVVEAVIDWARAGRTDPIREPVLTTLAKKVASHRWPNLAADDADVHEAVKSAQTPPLGWGDVAMIGTQLLADEVRGYRPFDYLVAFDEGPPPNRPIPDWFWPLATEDGALSDWFAVGLVALLRGQVTAAVNAFRLVADTDKVPQMFALLGRIELLQQPAREGEACTWFEKAAAAGDAKAMEMLGIMAEHSDPPDLPGAQAWYEKAAATNSSSAMVRLGVLLSDVLDPPDLPAARGWYEKAADAGNTDAMTNLGNLLQRSDPRDLPGARYWWEKAANAGNVHAMTNLGSLLSNDWDPLDLPTARDWYEKAAAGGDVRAIAFLGRLLLEQLEPPDVPAARGWLEQAAEAGRTDAMVNLGVMCTRQSQPDLPAARDWWEKAAAAGDTNAMTRLGALFADHWDPPDPAVARGWFEQAANAGDTNAMLYLGILLTKQSPPDLPAARDWWEKAAIAGNAEAMNKLASLLTTQWAPPELATARMWYEKAANNGHIEAMYHLGVLLTDYWKPPELVTARAWYEKAAEAGHLVAMLNLGALLTNRVSPPDVTTARTWYEKAANAGLPAAMYSLGFLLVHRWQPPEIHTAREWWEKAALAGHLQAMTSIAWLLAEVCNPPDLATARDWAEKAADRGHADAMGWLGFSYLRLSQPPDLSAARTWYERAADTGDVDSMYNLGMFLAEFWDPSGSITARYWLQKAATAGHIGARAYLARLDPSDEPGTRR